MTADRRRRLPSVGALVEAAEAAGLVGRAGRTVVVAAARAAVADARANGGAAPADGWLAEVERRALEAERPSLVRVINATGVVLHTNLGRAPLAPAAIDAMVAAAGYSALEFDLDRGERGSRQHHVGPLLAELTGAEAGLATVNAAAALVLAVQALAGDGETLVSRGELVAIGGGFRLPEILGQTGTALTEVGTTNRTSITDYDLATSPRTRLALKVHQSNFAMHGFTEEVSVRDLVARCAPRGIPVVHDVGSGLMVALDAYGLRGEPLVRESVAAGALTIFSGDKLLGGPQAGLIVGPGAIIARLGAHPLARALRPDKVTLAGLEATLALYRDVALAVREIPVLAMLTADPATLKRRARRLARRIEGATTESGRSAVGGGAFPGAELPTTLVSIPTESPDTLVAALRRHDPPIIARAAEDRVLLDVRTMRDVEFADIVSAVGAARA